MTPEKSDNFRYIQSSASRHDIWKAYREQASEYNQLHNTHEELGRKYQLLIHDRNELLQRCTKAEERVKSQQERIKQLETPTILPKDSGERKKISVIRVTE